MKMDVVEHLEHFGFAIEENVIPKDECVKLANILDQMESEQRASGKTKYLSNNQAILFHVHMKRPDIFLKMIDIPQIMNTVSKILRENFILSNLSASRSGPKSGESPHIDSRTPIPDFSNTTHIVAMLCLDDFTAQNGATIVWPFSHKSTEDPRYIKQDISFPGKVQCCAQRGSVIYWLGQTWHDVGHNLDGSRRWGLVAYYNRWWIKPNFDMTQCGSEIYNLLTSRQKALLGFNSRPPLDAEKRVNTLVPVEDLPDNYEATMGL